MPHLTATTATLAAACLALAAASPAMALIIDDGGTTVIDSTVNDFIEVADGPGGQPTTVVFEPGANITDSDSVGDTVFVTGGSSVVINGGQFFEDVTALDDASLTINGGTIGNDALGFNNNVVTITGGTVSNDVEVFANSSLVVTGGLIGDDLEASDGSSVTFSGGTVTDNLSVENFATALITGGTIGNDLEAIGNVSITVLGGSIGSDIEAVGSATIDIFGGQLGAVGGFEFGIASGGFSVVTLFGPEFQINGSPAAFGSISQGFGTLSGTLSDGSVFSVPFERVDEGFFFPRVGQIVLVEQAIPEPGSLALLSLGGVTLLRRRGDFRERR
ncbi:MAG: PEP-CTERM sorting domain-containing protein [Planctomycetota bacterium]